MNPNLCAASTIVALVLSNSTSCSAQASRSDAAAAAAALAAIPLDSLTPYSSKACPTIVLDESIRYSEGTPIRNDNLPVVLRLTSNEAAGLHSKCGDIRLQALPVLPDTAAVIARLQRVRLFLTGKPGDSSRRFMALISPPGLANPTLVFVDLVWKGDHWAAERTVVRET